MVKTTENFIIEANTIYNNKFIYSKTMYSNNYTKVTITCPTHGDFEQTPLQHLRGNGCVACTKELDKQKRIAAFVSKANTLHKNKYAYNTLEYIDNRTPLSITCPIHGTFKQTPNNHLKEHGCRKCQYDSIKTTLSKPQQTFLDECALIHNAKYDYTNTKYVNTNTKITAVCPIHGTFEQWAGHHIRGVGCPTCSPGGFNKNKPGILYYLSINNGECFKIGITNLSISERYSKTDLQKITLLDEILYPIGEDAYKQEQLILQKYSYYKYTTTKPLSSGNTELFNTDIRKINEVTSIREL